MDDIKVISGTTSVYATQEMKPPFKKVDTYPIAWEVVFRNDTEGKAFSRDLIKAFSTLPNQQGFILDSEQPINEPIQCMECVFKDKDSFRAIIQQVFKERSFMDEEKQKIIPKTTLLSEVGKLVQKETALAC